MKDEIEEDRGFQCLRLVAISLNFVYLLFCFMIEIGTRKVQIRLKGGFWVGW